MLPTSVSFNIDNILIIDSICQVFFNKSEIEFTNAGIKSPAYQGRHSLGALSSGLSSGKKIEIRLHSSIDLCCRFHFYR